MIDVLPAPQLMLDYGGPPLLVSERAHLPCGCGCLIGKRLDRRPPEVATVAYCCPAGHEQLAAHFNLLLRESLVEPTDRPLVDICNDLLHEAERHWREP